MDNQYTVSSFLGRYNFDLRGPSVNTIIDALLYDMEEGLRCGPVFPPKVGTALDMIPTWLLPPAELPKNTSVIVVDAGGTNFRSCLVSFDSTSKPSISQFERSPMPATDREYSKEEFYDTMASYLDRLKNAAETIGFCFSYPMKITPDGDGEVLRFSKEIKAPQVVGSSLGKSLAEALQKRGWTPLRRITLLNDTVAALFAGAATSGLGKKYSSYVGFILGTGTNTAYIEYDPIAKLEGGTESNVRPSAQIIVCESGKSNKIPRSYFDEIIAQKTNEPELYWLEKMCSGAYLGSLAAHILRIAARDGIFSDSINTVFSTLESLSLIEANQFLSNPYAEDTLLGAFLTGKSERDRELTYRLVDAVVIRAARLAAGNIAAAVIKSGKGSNPISPVCILAEGTTFLKMHHLYRRVTSYLQTVLTEQRGIYFDIETTDNAVTLGTAIAGLI
ncbi:MAG: hexokinase family protein [Treponema sp.]